MLKSIYLTMSPLILGGITNIIFTKTKLYRRYQSPIDGGKCLKDGRRIFGDNKTIIGFISMVCFCTVYQLLCGLLCNLLDLNGFNDLYSIHPNTIGLNLLFGLLVGITYMLFELPNSFLKRRLGIGSGKQGNGMIGTLFFIIDQIDSLIGVFFVLFLFSDIGVIGYLIYLFVGAFTHIAINVVLRMLKLRKSL